MPHYLSIYTYYYYISEDINRFCQYNPDLLKLVLYQTTTMSPNRFPETQCHVIDNPFLSAQSVNCH